MILDPVDPKVPTLLEVWAPHCSLCAAMEPNLVVVADRFSDLVRFRRVDAHTQSEDIRRLGVRGTPTLIGYVDGNEVYRSVGAVSRSELEAVFASLAEGNRPGLRLRTEDIAIRGGAGAALVIAGLLLGPSIPLVIVGLGVLSAAMFPLVRKFRADRS